MFTQQIGEPLDVAVVDRGGELDGEGIVIAHLTIIAVTVAPSAGRVAQADSTMAAQGTREAHPRWRSSSRVIRNRDRSGVWHGQGLHDAVDLDERSAERILCAQANRELVGVWHVS
jgi:hypothetical protein